jgi:hypothetical protein
MPRLMRAASSWTLALFFLAIFVAALIAAFGFPYRARLFPVFVISAGIVLVLAEIVIALIWPPAADADTGLDLKADDDYGFREALRAGVPIFAWIACLIVGIWLIGPTIAVPLWLLAYFTFMVRGSVPATMLTVAGFTVLTIGLFDYLLQVPWPRGEIPHVQEWAQAVMEGWGI